MATPVGIVGFRGYSGAELVSILERHAHVEPVLLEHRETGDKPRPLGHPGPKRVPMSPEAVHAEGLAAVFLATPAEVSIELALPLLETGAKVVDLSGAFRLGTVENYKRWYKEDHNHPELLISNPGCYPTAANLAIKPLVDAGVIDRSAGIVCDAKSGVSGAGRKPSLKTSFCEVTENFSAYSVLEHRHVPEILQTSNLEEHELSFAAQLIPIDRGILETIYFRAKNVKSADDLLAIYREWYADEPFVRLYAPGHAPDLRAVARTNFCDIGLHFDAKSGRAVVISAIDNLVKGAAGQAVQNMNLALGYPETTGLL